MQDPYDTYDWLLEHHRGEQVTFHVLAAMRNRPYDVGLTQRNLAAPVGGGLGEPKCGGAVASWMGCFGRPQRGAGRTGAVEAVVRHAL